VIDNEQKAELSRVFQRQKAARWDIARTPAAARIDKLRRLKAAIIARRDELAAAIHADFRKNQSETELTEIHPVLEEVNHAIKHLRSWMKPAKVKTAMIVAGTASELRYEPKGVVLILSPWTYPFALMLAPLVAAIASGNCVIMKPSEKTVNTSRFLGDLIRSIFDASEVALFEGDGDLAAALLELPFDHIFFTGSTRIGQKVMEAAARHLASVTLELGGKSPCIVDESADIAAAAERIVWGKFINAGQTCVAPDYIYVHASRAAELLDALKHAVAAFYGQTEEERKASASFSRLIDQGAYERVRALVERSIKGGAVLEIGGQFDAEQRYVAPTILSKVTPASPIMEEEIFGPVLPVLTYNQVKDVYRHIQAGGKPLALYVFSRDRVSVEEILANTSAGGTVVNNVVIHLANPHLPFGGVGPSGQGSYHGFFGFKAFSHERAVLKQGRMSLARYFYPPYEGRMKATAAAALRRLE
jgi:aldehyde dehydrogenase (NAD+)